MRPITDPAPTQPPVGLSYLESVAAEAARRAGALIARHLASGRRPQVTAKGRDIDLVTEVDLAAETVVLETLQSHFPDHSYLAEEGGRSQGTQDELLWVIDPIDGTTNFSHGVPHCAVSIACLFRERPVVGVIYDPARDELFSARQDGPAQLNGRQIRVTATQPLLKSLIATGFAYDRREKADFYIPIFREMMMRAQGLRRMGAAALDLAWVACGRYDAFYEANLSPWDVAAGVLIVERAGGLVTTYVRDDFNVLQPRRMLASNGLVHTEMVEILSQY